MPVSELACENEARHGSVTWECEGRKKTATFLQSEKMQKLFLHRKWLWENHYKVVKEQISFSGGAGGRLCFPQCWCKQAESPLLPADAITALRSGAAGGEQRWCSAPCNKCLCRALGRSVPAAIHTRTHPSSPALFHFLLLTHAAASEQGWILLWLLFFFISWNIRLNHICRYFRFFIHVTPELYLLLK